MAPTAPPGRRGKTGKSPARRPTVVLVPAEIEIAPPPAPPPKEETNPSLVAPVPRLPGAEHETAVYRLKGPGAELATVEASLVVIAHPSEEWLGRRFPVAPGEEVGIGRAPENRIGLSDVPSVSRRHAVVAHRGLRLVVSDVGSTNGTLVNDEWVDGERILRSGDRIQVGAVHFKLLHEKDVENAFHEAIYQLVATDGLTEVFNRRKYEEEAAREVERARRYGRPLSLVLFDIDHFKRINDACGHLCGDFVLQQAARAVRECLRDQEILARVGGEEFAILVPETHREGAAKLAERIRGLLEGRAFRWVDRELGVTASFGVAELDDHMKGPSDLFRQADRALYASKEGGRNRVTIATRPGDSTETGKVRRARAKSPR